MVNTKESAWPLYIKLYSGISTFLLVLIVVAVVAHIRAGIFADGFGLLKGYVISIIFLIAGPISATGLFLFFAGISKKKNFAWLLPLVAIPIAASALFAFAYRVICPC